jgi:hypothetical protein
MAVSKLKIRSGEITGTPGGDDWLRRSGARAQLYAAGFKREDFGKPIVTVAAPYLSYHMCNQKFRELADETGGELRFLMSLRFLCLFARAILSPILSHTFLMKPSCVCLLHARTLTTQRPSRSSAPRRLFHISL